MAKGFAMPKYLMLFLSPAWTRLIQHKIISSQGKRDLGSYAYIRERVDPQPKVM